MPQTDSPTRPTSSGSSTSTDANRAPGRTKTATPTRNPIGGYGASAPNVQQGTPGLRQENMAYDPETGTLGVAAGYYEGDEWMFISNGASPEEIASIQAMMVQANLLSGEVPLGVWDDRSAKAFTKILEVANRSGVDWSTALMGYADKMSIAGMKSGGSGRAPLQVRLSNPDDLREVFKQAAYNRMGGKFASPDQEQAFIDAFHAAESGYQHAAYNQGGTVVEPPSADTMAEQTLKETDAAGVEAGGYAGYARQWRDMLMGGAQ